jgi:hypothetical protein
MAAWSELVGVKLTPVHAGGGGTAGVVTETATDGEEQPVELQALTT